MMAAEATAANDIRTDTFPTWARFNGVRFTGAKLQLVGNGRGLGLVAAEPIHGDGGAGVVMKIPHDLVLSAEAVETYAKIDHNFKQLLGAAGRKSARGDILLYLVSHVAESRSPGGLVHTPWTKYIDYLPRSVPVPTMWSGAERELLCGTSLEAALKAKLATLQAEFELLRDATEELPFWNALFWAGPTVCFEDWLLVDAWYRSRCLELPGLEAVMVPALDMINHASDPSSLYEVDDAGHVHLVLRPEATVPQGKEITISYGQAKSASEMLFSYGFVDPTSSVTTTTMLLHLAPFPDDPLAAAKVHVFNGARVVKLFLEANDGIRAEDGALPRPAWHSPFVYLMCLNEEDGLSFHVLQDREGGRTLRLFWRGEDVTQRADELEVLVEGHPLSRVFRLRAVTVVLQAVEEQLANMRRRQSDAGLEPSQSTGLPRADCVAAAKLLKYEEEQLLAGAVEALIHERDTLLADDSVATYIQSSQCSAVDESKSEHVADTEEADFS